MKRDQAVLKQIGLQLRQKREEAGLSQQEIAKKVGVNRNVISSWENGESEAKILNFLAISETLGIELDEFFHSATGKKTDIEKNSIEKRLENRTYAAL